MPSHPTPHSRFLPGSHAAICDAPSVTADAAKQLHRNLEHFSFR
jgi:hypothetical protein